MGIYNHSQVCIDRIQIYNGAISEYVQFFFVIYAKLFDWEGLYELNLNLFSKDSG